MQTGQRQRRLPCAFSGRAKDLALPHAGERPIPYTIQDALGDERAFLEAVCDVMPLHFPLLSATALAEKLRICNERMNSAAPAKLPAEQAAGSSADLATFLKNYGEVYAAAVRVPPSVFQNEATETGLANMAFSLVNAADDIFFKTLPLLATDTPQAELSMPSYNLETDWDMNDIVVHVVRMYKKSCTKGVHSVPLVKGDWMA